MAEPGNATGEARPAVLLLDDEPDVLYLLRLLLERRGYAVFATSDGSEALRLLRGEPVAVAVVDLLMPGMSGRQFLVEVERLAPERRPSVLVVSGLRPEAAEKELEGLSYFALVSKPFEMAEIVDHVARAVQKRL